MKVGLLGGSFNPAHKGHLYISQSALKKLNLDQVWWLICDLNPLKEIHYKSCKERTEAAQNLLRANFNNMNGKIKVAQSPNKNYSNSNSNSNIINISNTSNVSDYNNAADNDFKNTINIKNINVNNIYTFEIIKDLKIRFPSYEFIWLMGADSIVKFHQWDRWETINKMLSIAIFERANYLRQAMRSKFTLRFKQNFVLQQKKNYNHNYWTFLPIRKQNISSTEIRKSLSSC